MLETTASFPLFDIFRVPYSLAAPDGRAAAGPRGCASIRGVRAGGRRRLYWPPAGTPGVSEPAEYRLDGRPLFAGIVPDEVASEWLSATGGAWRRQLPVTDSLGNPVASIWADDEGSVFLPFAPEEAIATFLSERYQTIARPSSALHAKALARRSYYTLRPLMPRPLQIALRRSIARLQARQTFPAWPQETALHDLYDLVLSLAAGVAGEPIPTIAPWPSGHTWAFVLTHDVEQQIGFDNLDRLLEVERAAGYRSSWNLVPRRYEIDDETVKRLAEHGCEVGVHGLYHDGHDLESEERLRERLPEMHDAARRWGSTGFRSPATHRHWELMPLLGFDYDSSYPDSDPFEPYGGGCCSWLPFFNSELVELPITLVQDHTMFVILRRSDESLWVDKAEFLRERRGLALLITHPDYMLDEARLGCYARLLAHFAGDETMWHALPCEISRWWRRRAASSIVRDGSGWTIEGPADVDGRVVLVPGDRAVQAA